MPLRTLTATFALALLAACGGSDPEVPSLDVRDPGQGTGTLLVEASVKGEALTANARHAGEFRTRYHVVVRRRGVAVGDAHVRVNDLVLVHAGGGVYVEPAQQLGLPPPIAALSVRAGDDWLAAGCSSPGGHGFLRPARGGEVLPFGPSAPLELSWARASRADDAALDVSGWSAVGDLDDGRMVVPFGVPGVRAGPASCGLWRANRVPLRGGRTGSFLTVSVWNGLDFALQGT